MLCFQSRESELKYRAYFNAQQFSNDRLALAIGIICGTYTVLRVWASQTLWIPRGFFYLLVSIEKVVASDFFTVDLVSERCMYVLAATHCPVPHTQVILGYYILGQPSIFIRYRTMILSGLRIVNMMSGDMYSSFWAGNVDLTKSANFYGIALGNGGNIMCLLFW